MVTDKTPGPICTGSRSCTNAATEDHTCPYRSDINDDDETLCNCCAECEENCSDDI